MVAIFDVDGVLSTGQFLYDENGKRYKTFGPDDALALQLLRERISVVIVSGDKRGWDISKKRVSDMGFDLTYAPSLMRVEWLEQRWKANEVFYMGDSFTDIAPSDWARYAICPNDSFYLLRNYVDYICVHDGGHRAVAEAVFKIYEQLGLPIKGDLI